MPDGNGRVALVTGSSRGLGAVIMLGRAVLPAMQAGRYGRIVHIDSEVAGSPPPGRSAYATAKNAQIGLTLC